jgi:hypothetical protein
LLVDVAQILQQYVGKLRHVGSWYATALDSVRAAGCEISRTVRMGAAPLVDVLQARAAHQTSAADPEGPT